MADRKSIKVLRSSSLNFSIKLINLSWVKRSHDSSKLSKFFILIPSSKMQNSNDPILGWSIKTVSLKVSGFSSEGVIWNGKAL